jgi:hypothetical protein
MKNHFRNAGIVIAAVLMLVGAFAPAFPAQQAAPQVKPEDAKKLLQEIAGDYAFDFQGQPMTVNFFEKDGRLYGAPVGETPEELLPVEGSPLKFTVTPASAGQTYELEFARNDKKMIDRCLIKVSGMEILGTKIIK